MCLVADGVDRVHLWARRGIQASAWQAQRWWAGTTAVVLARQDGMEVVFFGLAMVPGVGAGQR